MKNFILTWWQQILLLASAIGFFIVKYFELRLKRQEIKYNLFHKEKVDRIMKYYDLLIEFDRQVYSLADRIRIMPMHEFEQRMVDLGSAYNNIVAASLPFDLLAERDEFTKLAEVREICKAFLLPFKQNQRMDSEQVLTLKKQFSDEFRDKMMEISDIVRSGMLKKY